jgi:putative phosphoesterase
MVASCVRPRSLSAHAPPHQPRSACDTLLWFTHTVKASAAKQPFAQRSATLSLNQHGGLRLAVVADTHSHPHPEAAARIADLAVDGILHAGDIGDLSVLDDLAKIAPVIAVRGNIDSRAPHLPDAVAIHLQASGETALTLLLMHIVVYGPKIRADAARLAQQSGAKLIVCGHSHVPFIGRDRGLMVFNPGSIGPRRMHLPIVFGVLEIEGGKLSVKHIDCETGEPWLP